MTVCFTENLRAVAPDLYMYFLMRSIREKGLPCGRIDWKSPASSICIKRFSPKLRVFATLSTFCKNCICHENSTIAKAATAATTSSSRQVNLLKWQQLACNLIPNGQMSPGSLVLQCSHSQLSSRHRRRQLLTMDTSS